MQLLAAGNIHLGSFSYPSKHRLEEPGYKKKVEGGNEEDLDFCSSLPTLFSTLRTYLNRDLNKLKISSLLYRSMNNEGAGRNACLLV